MGPMYFKFNILEWKTRRETGALFKYCVTSLFLVRKTKKISANVVKVIIKHCEMQMYHSKVFFFVQNQNYIIFWGKLNEIQGYPEHSEQ